VSTDDGALTWGGRLSRVGELLSLHPLTMEDALTFERRPKLEEYPGYVSVVLFGVEPGPSIDGPMLREVHLIISGRYVVTIHRRPFGVLDELRSRYHQVRTSRS
jgi:magnesium transporter